ncbi:MAG: PorP/SprF family type IX secretion system membrane protein [Bacteroidales bacterium]|jgi:type IX secretion system PorP/SprF family membrane protein|nr:PorP/SprF family type IX secretion system membrane protein [Bacteroidales bacterium]
MIVKQSKGDNLKTGVFVVVLQCFLCFSTSGQDAVFSQFMFDALSVNPGLAGINDYIKVSGGFRDQWPLMDHAYVSYFASYDQKIPSINSGIGAQVFRDVAGGIYSRTSVEIYYNYQFKISNQITLSPGLQMSVVQRAMNGSGLTLPDDNPYSGTASSEYLSDYSSVFPDFGVGVVANFSDRYSMGVAAHHLNGPIETLSEVNKKRTPLSLSAHFISYFPLRFGKFNKQKIVFSPGFYFRQQQYQNIFSLGLNVAYEPVFMGVWMRTASGFTPESATFLVGLEQINYRIVYNYDYKLSHQKGEFPGTGAHEITLVWKIHPKKKMKTIKCSKYSL